MTLALCAQKMKKKIIVVCCNFWKLQKPIFLYRQYFYRSATSDTMRKDLKEVVESVKNIVNLKSKDIVVDIGANDCTLLNFYPNSLRLVGFEPAKNIKFIDENKKY